MRVSIYYGILRDGASWLACELKSTWYIDDSDRKSTRLFLHILFNIFWML